MFPVLSRATSVGWSNPVIAIFHVKLPAPKLGKPPLLAEVTLIDGSGVGGGVTVGVTVGLGVGVAVKIGVGVTEAVEEGVGDAVASFVDGLFWPAI
jgi:hypothetical protein